MNNIPPFSQNRGDIKYIKFEILLIVSPSEDVKFPNVRGLYLRDIHQIQCLHEKYCYELNQTVPRRGFPLSGNCPWYLDIPPDCCVAFCYRYVDTVQDFFIKLGNKPRPDILKISIFSLSHVIARSSKIMNTPSKLTKLVLLKSFFGIKNQPNLSGFFLRRIFD